MGNTARAQFRPAYQSSLNSFTLTNNYNADYCVITSQNVREIALNTELMDAYKVAWNNSEDRVHQLESKPDLGIWYFIGGFALGVYLAK
jgi:hypothetical protein